jgi:hypothetical protein
MMKNSLTTIVNGEGIRSYRVPHSIIALTEEGTQHGNSLLMVREE